MEKIKKINEKLEKLSQEGEQKDAEFEFAHEAMQVKDAVEVFMLLTEAVTTPHTQVDIHESVDTHHRLLKWIPVI